MKKLVIMFFVFTLMLVNTTSIYAGELTPTDKILVDGVKIEDEPLQKMSLGGGTIEYLPADRSLILDSVDDPNISIIFPEGVFRIKLRGENKISDIGAHGNLRIINDSDSYSDLELISSKSYALYVKETLDIEGANISIKSNDIGIKNGEGFFLENSSLYIEANNFGIKTSSSIVIKESFVGLDIPYGYGLYSTNSSIYVNYADIIANTKKAALYAGLELSVKHSRLELVVTEGASIVTGIKKVTIVNTELNIDEPVDFRDNIEEFVGDADYSELFDLVARLPESYENYTEESVLTLNKVLESLIEIYNLSSEHQFLVDAKVEEFKEAFANLELKKEEVIDLFWDANKGADGVEFSVDWDAENFVALFVDGKELVNKKDFTYKSGSTVINLLPEYLKTLKTGEYDIKVVFMYAKNFDGVLKVVNNDLDDKKEEVKPEIKPESKPKTPPTGIKENIYTYIGILFISLIYTLKFRKKKYS